MASLCHLKPHLASLVMSEDEHELNPSGALMSLIAALNTLTPNPRASTPSAVIVKGTDNSGWVRNEQQDAQEFFQKLTGALEKEVARFLDRRKRRTRMGLEGAVECAGDVKKGGVWGLPELGAALGKEYRSPFEGLFAQRVGCLRCGYVEAISLQPFTSLSLSLPSSVSLLPALNPLPPLIEPVGLLPRRMPRRIHRYRTNPGGRLRQMHPPHPARTAPTPCLATPR